MQPRHRLLWFVYLFLSDKLFSMRILSLLTALCLSCFSASAQTADYSNRGLMDIKEQSESLHNAWNKAFDDAVTAKNFAQLVGLRKENELYLDHHLSAMRRMYAEGDGRATLQSVSNYLQIERQFVRDAMVPAESLTAANQEGIDKIYQKITDFGEKEKVFLVEINNALVTEGENAQPAGAPAQIDPEMNVDEEEHEGSVIEGKSKRKSKSSEEKSKKKKSKSSDDDDDTDL